MKKDLRLFLMLFMLSTSLIAWGQQRKVSGDVYDSDGMPLPGVAVAVAGTTNGIMSDMDGKFTLTVSPEAKELTFSFIGFETQKVAIEAGQSIKVYMKTAFNGLDEIVVMGYGSFKKSDLTGSVSSISSEDIASLPVSSAEQALAGKASGVRVVQNSGQPGAATTIRVRGTNSIQGGNNPLIIVDGFPITGGLETINPSNIENLEILKDASSTAIYGARATNGVIIVTTKRGKSGDFNIDVDAYFGVQQQAKKIDLMNADQFMATANERAVNDGEAELFFPDPSAVTVDTDWIDEMFNPSPIQSYTVSFSGASEKIKFLHSFNYFDQDGILEKSAFKKISMRNNLEVDMAKWLTISNSSYVTRVTQNYSGDGGNRAISEAHLAPPTVPVYEANGEYGDVTQYPFSPGAMDNPMKWINEYDDESLKTTIFDNFYASIKLTENLTFKSSVGIDYSIENKSWYLTRLLLDGAPGGKAGKYEEEAYSVLNENVFSYNNTFGVSKIDAVLGTSTQKYKKTWLGASSNNFLTDDLGSNVLDAGSDPQIPTSGQTEWGIQSLFGRVNYSYNEKYLLSATLRADASSVFAKENRWAMFPSAAFGWRASEEDFLKDVEWVSNLKVRTSIGQTGNQAVSPYGTWSKMETRETVLGDQLQIGYVPGNIPVPDLKWETTTQFDLGVDFGILDERISFVIDYYSKRTKDLLALVDLPASSGYTSSTQNIGEMQNRGFEFSVNAGIIDNTDFKWNGSLQVSVNRNKVLKLAKGADVFAPKVSNLIPSFHIITEGQPISMFYGFVRDGYDETGRNKYKDFAGRDSDGNLVMEPDGAITDDDRQIIGSPHPKFTFGLNNTFSYKGVSLNVFIDGAQGLDLVWASKMGLQNSFSRGGNQVVDVYNDHWTPTNTDAKNPIISADNEFKQADDFIEDGSYIKIRTINLSYTIPSTDIKWLRNAQVYVNAQNMFTFTKYSGYDPEVSSFSSGDLRLGVDQNAYPSTKTVTMGIRVGI